jgi:cation diffusion facilitator family transporter
VRTRMGDEDVRTVLVALAANVIAALAKTAVALVTGSTAMSAEAAQAFADTGNQVLLLIAQRRSVRPADERHPFGYGRDAYFWALIASVGVFVTGALFSLREGIDELVHPTQAGSFLAAYVVLAIASVLDLVSLVQALRQLRSEARSLQRDLLAHLQLTSDPTARAVFAENAAAFLGDVVAALGVALHQATGSSAPDGIAAVLIGLLVAGVGVQLARRNHDFLLGEPVAASTRARIETFLRQFPGVEDIRELVVTFLGPRQVRVLARVDIDDNLRGDEVERLVTSIEEGLKQESEFVARVDVVAVGRPAPGGGTATSSN